MAAADLERWATSGAMALTGAAGGPPRAEPALVGSAAAAAAGDLAAMTARFGHMVEVDGPALLGERAAFAGLRRNGSVSVGRAARFERAVDGWVVLNLPRADDVELLPALLGAALDPADWSSVRGALSFLEADVLVARGAELGLAIARPDERAQLGSPARELVRGSHKAASRPDRAPLIIDMTSLWAGPLAGSLLADAGARVIKVEGRGRPDGARGGPAAFFDLLNAGKECLAIDFSDRDDVALLRRLISEADLVLEGSRPRAMSNIGVDPTSIVDASATSWVSITGHGRHEQPDRIGFGDDAAVAGGLWVAGPEPMFVADAVADPLTGMVAAALAAELLASDRAAVLDIALSRVAAWAQSRPVTATVSGSDADGWVVDVDGDPIDVAEPRARAPRRRAAPLDAHGPALRAEFAER